MPRIAGRNVSAKKTELPTTSALPSPMERSVANGKTMRPESPMATAMPEKTTAFPLVATARATASPTSCPLASSSRKRLTRNNE